MISTTISDAVNVRTKVERMGTMTRLRVITETVYGETHELHVWSHGDLAEVAVENVGALVRPKGASDV